jgi:hypothetical protein
MKRHFAGLMVVAVLGMFLMVAEDSQAASWIFGPPIYKQPKPLPLMVQPQVDRGPYYSEPQGEYTGTSTRFLNSVITIQGRTVDDYMVRQSYVQQGTEDE